MAFPLMDLPIDLIQGVYERLDVHDRTRFAMALPKTTPLKRKCKQTEKRLGILIKSIKSINNISKRHHFEKLSPNMMVFLQTCDPKDPTLHTISELYPDDYKTLMDTKQTTLIERICNNSLNEEDVQWIVQNFCMIDTSRKVEDFHLARAFYACGVPTFQTLSQNALFCEWVRINANYYYFKLFCHGNIEMLDYMATHASNLFGWNMELLGAFMKNAPDDMWILRSDQRRCLMKHVGISRERLEKIWRKCVEDMELDNAEDIIGYLSGKNNFSDRVI